MNKRQLKKAQKQELFNKAIESGSTKREAKQISSNLYKDIYVKSSSNAAESFDKLNDFNIYLDSILPQNLSDVHKNLIKEYEQASEWFRDLLIDIEAFSQFDPRGSITISRECSEIIEKTRKSTTGQSLVNGVGADLRRMVSEALADAMNTSRHWTGVRDMFNSNLSQQIGQAFDMYHKERDIEVMKAHGLVEEVELDDFLANL